jgi:hypothetical protein
MMVSLLLTDSYLNKYLGIEFGGMGVEPWLRGIELSEYENGGETTPHYYYLQKALSQSLFGIPHSSAKMALPRSSITSPDLNRRFNKATTNTQILIVNTSSQTSKQGKREFIFLIKDRP